MGDQTVAFHPDLTDEQRSNFVKLAAYLRQLPADYPKFEMLDYTNGADGNGKARVVDCGTAACAVGHGPAAGIRPELNEDWGGYSYRAFIEWSPDNDAWDWCFSGEWSSIDNSAHGAAARIEYMLAHGVPDNALSQMQGDAPLSYTVDTL